MKTILVVYTNNRPISVKQANDEELTKYCFRTEDNIEVGNVVKSRSYSSTMLVTDVIDEDFKYYNASSGKLTKEPDSTRCYPIKTLKLREEEELTVYGTVIQ